MSPPSVSSPYLGSRSFERTAEDRARFFGRDREIEELVGLVLSHSVVLVYAASGAGKTSLLNAGVIPALEARGFEVLPRGRVGVTLPPDAVLDEGTNPYVLNLLCSLSPEVPATSLLRHTIVDRLRELPRRARGAGRVLVIDQAEELFTFTPPDWPLHQRELFIALHEALRDAPDLRVVIVTREEYLAHFADLMPLLPGGLRARFHLDPLDREAARRAVEGPLLATERRFEQGVADRLVTDLSSRVKLEASTGRPVLEPGPYVEPVQLQIVCAALWQKLPDGVDVITAEHLQRYGDVEETLERFYEETIAACIRETAYDKERLARWIGTKLITPSETRGQVFRGPSETERLPNRVLACLEARHLIRADERASGCWYELAHDRLVRPVREVNARWRVEFDVAAVRRRSRRRIRRAALIGALVSFAVFALSIIPMRARARERALTVDRVEELQRCREERSAVECEAEAVRVFDSIAAYYWHLGRVDDLVELLKESARLIPESYAPGESPSSGSASGPRGLLRVEYRSGELLDEAQLRAAWDRTAKALREGKGLPVPLRIALVSRDDVAPGSLRIAAAPESCTTPPTRDRVLAQVRKPGGEALIAEPEIRALKDDRLRGFYDRYRDETWTEYEDPQAGGPWRVVPVWTLPVWRVAGHPARSAESLLADVIAGEVVKHPALILGCDALKVLLQRASEVAPVTVREAIAARTLEGLRRDFIALVRSGHDLRSLPEILDVLAERTTRHAAEGRLYGPWQQQVFFDPAKQGRTWIFRRMAKGLPPIAPQIWVKGAATPEVLDTVEDARQNLYLQYGVLAPEVARLPAEELSGPRSEDPDAEADDACVPIEVAAKGSPAVMPRKLEKRYRDHRACWVTAETLSSSLDDVRAGARAWRKWIGRHYSLTDLKRLARAVVAGDENEHATLRDLPWLLQSLVFWSRVHGSEDVRVAELAESLRETQGARLRRPASPRRDHDPRVLRPLRRGLDALDAGRIGEAAAHFETALRVDRKAAISAFLDLYPALSSLAPDRRRERLVATCRLPSPGASSTPPDAPVIYEIRDLLDTGGPLTAGERRLLELCLLWSVTDRGDRLQKGMQDALALAENARDPVETWPRNEALFLAHWLISHREQAPTPPERETAAVRKLLVRGLSAPIEAARLSDWRELRDRLGAHPQPWLRELIAEVARGLPAGALSTKLDMACWIGADGADGADGAGCAGPGSSHDG
ncbi:MAG TPA: ATP-binding protein [Kofleriaceae bacterium]|nr:ATP-binding protein [Kofleriaceae bacterium]